MSEKYLDDTKEMLNHLPRVEPNEYLDEGLARAMPNAKVIYDVGRQRVCIFMNEGGALFARDDQVVGDIAPFCS